MRIESVPEQKDRAGNPAQEMADETNELGTGDGAPDQAKVGVRVGRDGRNGGQLRPVEAVIEQGRLATRRPGLARGGQP